MICFSNRTARRGGQPRAVKMLRRLSVPSVFLLAALTGSAADAKTVQCQSEKGAGYPWAWRQIDGKRCWYMGKAGMDKKLLYWAANPKTPAPSRRRPSIMMEDRAERERLLHSYWPLLPPADAFDDRFEAARAKRL